MKHIKLMIFGLGILLISIFEINAFSEDVGSGLSAKRGLHREGAPVVPCPDGEFLPIGFLNLSDDQKIQIATIIVQYKELIQSNTESLITAEESLFNIVDSDTFDELALREAFQSVAGYKEEVCVIKEKIMNEIQQYFTTEQLELIQQRKDERAEKMSERMAKRLSMLNTWLETNTELLEE